MILLEYYCGKGKTISIDSGGKAAVKRHLDFRAVTRRHTLSQVMGSLINTVKRAGEMAQCTKALAV